MTKPSTERLSRRSFFKKGGALIAGGSFVLASQTENGTSGLQRRILGRTGFKVTDVGYGTSRVRDASLIRYAYDKGINYFDTAEGYGRGASESAIGEAMQFLERSRIYINTKLSITENDTTETILDRFTKCQERLKTEYVDALFIHNPPAIATLSHTGFHAAVLQLKQAGRIRHIGLSCHGVRNQEGSMSQILCAAAEDGRFDLMLMVYNFMNQEDGSNILKACAKHDVGVTVMKSAPGVFYVESFDPENLTEQQVAWVDRQVGQGLSREQAVERLKQNLKSQSETHEKTKPFIQKYGIENQDLLRNASIQWVLSNPEIDTVCVSMNSYEDIDRFVPLSGTKLSLKNAGFLEAFAEANGNLYCRHGCTRCISSCPKRLPVSTIMRYVYYYEFHGEEKLAMEKYAGLRLNASLCKNCPAPCLAACPYGVDVPVNLVRAHRLLTLV